MPKLKQETWTNKVLRILVDADDFMNYAMLCKATGANLNQISASCLHMLKRRAVDVVIDKDGVGWWYATPDTDNRTRARREQIPSKTRKPRKPTDGKRAVRVNKIRSQ